MLVKTHGIVLSYIRYREASIITRIFTEEIGIQSYIVNSVRQRSSRTRIALYQPLTLLDLVVYRKPNASLNRIAEIRCLHPYKTLHTDPKKSCIAMFLSEILGKVLKEEESHPELFHFITDALVYLDNEEAGYENFHLIFLFQLTLFLGIAPSSPEDLTAGSAVLLSAEIRTVIEKIQDSFISSRLSITNSQRRELLDLLIRFYTSHIDSFGEVRSLKIVKEILQ